MAAVHTFVYEQAVPLIAFAKRQRKDDVMAEQLKGFGAAEAPGHLGVDTRAAIRFGGIDRLEQGSVLVR